MLLAVGALLCLPATRAATMVPRAADLHERVIELPVAVPSPLGEVSGTIAVTVFRPAGAGPFPLAVMNHGRAIGERRAQQGRQRFEALARYLVGKGFAVFVPTRLGYGDTFGTADPESAGSCQALHPERAARASSEQVLAVAAYARTQRWIDASRWIVIGQSVGGLTASEVAAVAPEGLVGAINFSGGIGGNPDLRPGAPCSPQATEAMWRSRSAGARVSVLWLYWDNDRYWGDQWPRRWADAWRQGGGSLEFHQLEPVGTDGHNGLSVDMDHWVPIVEHYLAGIGFGRPGVVPRPLPTSFAGVEDADKVPVGPVGRSLYVDKFLAARPPRAFAIGPDGASGWASGDWAMGRALGFCQTRRGAPCRLYAVDDDVVWTP